MREYICVGETPCSAGLGLHSPTWLLHKSLFDSFTAHYSSCREHRVSSSTSGAELEGEAAATEDAPGKLLGASPTPGHCPAPSWGSVLRSFRNLPSLSAKASPKSQPERPPLLRNNYLWFGTWEQMVFLY